LASCPSFLLSPTREAHPHGQKLSAFSLRPAPEARRIFGAGDAVGCVRRHIVGRNLLVIIPQIASKNE
jgi:hypothetical protein